MENRSKGTINERTGFIWPFCAVFCLAGAVTGAVVFMRSFTDADVLSYIEAQRLFPSSFSECLIFCLRREFVFLAALLLMACFAFGWMIVPLALFYRGLGIGIGACCLFDRYEWFGALYALAVVIFPSAAALIAHTLAGRDAVSVSFGLFKCLTGRNAGEYGIMPLIVKIPLCAAVIVCASALTAAIRIPLYAIIC